MRDRLKILTVNHTDDVGGAAIVARNCFLYYDALGHDSRFLVQDKLSSHEKVIPIGNEKHWNYWRKGVTSLQKKILNLWGAKKGIWRLVRLMDWLADFPGKVRCEIGLEEFNFPGTVYFFKHNSFKPDIVHLHLPRAGFFDLRYLPELSEKTPVFFTLHGAWLLAGHCVHSFNCDRWKTGCGKCPDLSIPSPIKRDSSSLNWKRKNRIYSNSKIYVGTPCNWLMDKVKHSMLAQATIETRVIPHGVDQSIFFPGDRSHSRSVLGLEQESFIYLFSANGIKRNRWKDFAMMKKALTLVSEQQRKRKIIFLALGDSDEPIMMGNTEIRFMPYRSEPKSVADFYRASDVYLHASKADTFPNAVLEALSCGVPVIGTAVGGIPEQIRGWEGIGFLTKTHNRYDHSSATGVLVEAGEAISFSKAMTVLMDSNQLRNQLGQNAAKDAKERFPLQKQTDAYLDWYREILTKNNYE